MTPSTKAAPRVGFTATIVRHGPGAYFELRRIIDDRFRK